MRFVFATNNKHEISEIQHLVKGKFTLLSLQDIDCDEELAETGNTLEKNALQKARYVSQKYKIDCFADDTGLMIDSLEGRPGVLSARYAGEEKNADKNMEKILGEMDGIVNRNASFVTVIALILNGKEHVFEGRVAGTIAPDKRGNSGFGYDPIFIPNGKGRSFAEMNLDEKNKISHRAEAVKKLSDFLNQLTG